MLRAFRFKQSLLAFHQILHLTARLIKLLQLLSLCCTWTLSSSLKAPAASWKNTFKTVTWDKALKSFKFQGPGQDQLDSELNQFWNTSVCRKERRSKSCLFRPQKRSVQRFGLLPVRKCVQVEPKWNRDSRTFWTVTLCLGHDKTSHIRNPSVLSKENWFAKMLQGA